MVINFPVRAFSSGVLKVMMGVFFIVGGAQALDAPRTSNPFYSVNFNVDNASRPWMSRGIQDNFYADIFCDLEIDQLLALFGDLGVQEFLRFYDCQASPIDPGVVPEYGDFVTFESGHVRPLVLSSDGTRLYAVNTPDARVEVFDVSGDSPVPIESIAVGLEPVALALNGDQQLWVVNHLSDSVSVVDVSTTPAVITNTLLVGDEPRDIVFSGPERKQAFITAAHRGQNVPFDPQLSQPGVGRADVWVFDSDNLGLSLGGEPLTILTMFGDTLRGLATNASGTRVYAAVLNSGNRSTVLTDDRQEGGIDKPSPLLNQEGFFQPDSGLIVQFDGEHWVDGGDPVRDVAPKHWDERVKLALPDNDLFSIDTSARLPKVIEATPGVGTTLFNVAVNPISEVVYVSNQEALNLTRFEGPGTNSTTLRGHFVENRVTVVDQFGAHPRHLNKHIDYTTQSELATDKAHALATPLQMSISADGKNLYLVAMGSGKLARLSTASLDNDSFSPQTMDQLTLSGGGPTGVVLDDRRQRAYVLTRFDHGVSVIDTSADLKEISHLTFFNPEPEIVQQGRHFLYDASYTSSRGDSSCSGCHVFGDMDHLAWDLGNPDGLVTGGVNVYNENIPLSIQNLEVHPMKGPMTTQSLRGLTGNGPMHWRGDRSGQSADADETLEEQAFEDFNGAFVDLLGRQSPLSDDEMDSFAKFALQLSYPPNPVARLDNQLSEVQARAKQDYDTVVLDQITTCNGCHKLDESLGQFGTDGAMSIEGPSVEEDMKIPHLRNMYQKVGMFTRNTQVPQQPFMGDQIRGFGYDNSGASGSIDLFLQENVFSIGDVERQQFEQFLLAFPSELAPIVGQQVTVNSDNKKQQDVIDRLNLLVERGGVVDPRPHCDLIVKGLLGDTSKGWVMTRDQRFLSSNSNEPPQDVDQLLSALTQYSDALTFTCVPPGSGARMGIDRDADGVRDRD